IRLELTTTEASCDVVADPAQLEQVLLNLGINARDAMPQGGTLSIRTETVVLEAADAARRGHPIEPGEYATMRIVDTGIGMSADVQARIFEPFFTTKPKGLGTGLGLSTVYGIVKQSGGYLWVQSRPGEGTEFTVCLPRRRTVASPEQPEPGQPAVAAVAPATVLVVEDDDGVRTLVRRTLGAAGYEIHDARSPVEALAILESDAAGIDLMLSDIVMPDTSGPCLAAEAHRRWPHLRLLYMSGYTGEMLERHGLGEVDVPLLEKPFTGGELLDVIRRVLDAPPGLRVA
ncbi:MAG: ATP-binding protein, partial [Longimicrobiales bacterium]